MILLRLALRSLMNRWGTVALTVFATAVSVGLFLGVEKLRSGARESFANTVSGVDLIVGARSGSVQLLLYSVFRIGNATNTISWTTYQKLAELPNVEWIVPISLGDSHRGFRVLGTTTEFFERYKYRKDRPLAFAEGKPFSDLFDAVLGADVAKDLGYRLGDKIVLAHGIASFTLHGDKPFKVSGVLEKTGTPVDRTVHVSLEGIEAIHVDWRGSARIQGRQISADEVRALDLQPQTVTAALIGVSSKLAIFRLQRGINQYREEPLSAVLPGVALQELWSLLGVAETALAAVSVMIVATALLGMAAMILAGLNERRREMAILRSVGAPPRTIIALLVLEAGLISLFGAVLGLAAIYCGFVMLQPWLDATYGLYIEMGAPSIADLLVLGAIVAAGALVGLVPALQAYRLSLADGMTVRQ